VTWILTVLAAWLIVGIAVGVVLGSLIYRNTTKWENHHDGRRDS
jgi:uncharacterized membrane-anchored protein YhcB (DUF1043 family)